MVLLREVKKKVLEVTPEADVILYGSRARKTSTAGSDWDFLILVDDNSNTLTDKIRHKIYEVEWATGEVLSSIVRNRQEWNSIRYKALPFYKNVLRDGVRA
jgi:predicted nucleotidyltransferase